MHTPTLNRLEVENIFQIFECLEEVKEEYLMSCNYVELRLNTDILEQDAGHSLACGLQGLGQSLTEALAPWLIAENLCQPHLDDHVLQLPLIQ